MRLVWMVTAGSLAGCSAMAPAPVVAFSDPACAVVARQRQADAAANGYDAGMQVRVSYDAYATCLDEKKVAMTVGN